MNEDDYQNIISKLPQMTKRQLTELRRRVLFFIDDKEAGGVTNEDWILHGIITVLNERGLGYMIPPHFRIRKSRSFAGYETSADRIRTLLTDAIPEMTVTEQRSLGVIAARALADYISSWSSISFDSLMRNVSKIPEALDEAFPGYISSGLIRYIFIQRREPV
jgi:hypothetical protein